MLRRSTDMQPGALSEAVRRHNTHRLASRGRQDTVKVYTSLWRPVPADSKSTAVRRALIPALSLALFSIATLHALHASPYGHPRNTAWRNAANPAVDGGRLTHCSQSPPIAKGPTQSGSGSLGHRSHLADRRLWKTHGYHHNESARPTIPRIPLILPQ
jgi:hypothetical protein